MRFDPKQVSIKVISLKYVTPTTPTYSNSLDPTSRKIAEGFEFVNGIDSGIARVIEGDFAFMNSGTFLRYLIASNFTNAYGQTQLHITKECFVPFRKAWRWFRLF